MLGQYGLFEEQLQGLSRDDRLRLLSELITTDAGKEITLNYYLQENWSQDIKRIASEEGEFEAYANIASIENGSVDQHNKKKKVFAYDRSVRPCLIIEKNGTKRFGFNTPESIYNSLLYGKKAIFESQTRCQFKRPSFIAEYGTEYKKPLHDFLTGFAKNDECDGIHTLTIDFDTDKAIDENFVSSLIVDNPNKSKALYASTISDYVLLFKETLPNALQPTSIRYTGRGFQFIYDLRYTYYFNKETEEGVRQQKQFVLDVIMWLRRALEVEHIAFFNDMGCMLPEGVKFKLDKAFETNISQTRRVPSSYNDKTGMYSAYIYLDKDLYKNSHSLGELISFCKDNYKELFELKANILKRPRKSSKMYTEVESLIFAKLRVKALTSIVDNRYQSNTLVGSRHNFITQMTNAMADQLKYELHNTEPSYEKLFNKMVTFNHDHFKEYALKLGEVKSAVKGAMRRRERILLRGDSTNLSNSVICDFLQLTEVEEGILRGTTLRTKRQAKKESNLMTRLEKAVKINEMKQNGYTFAEIADAFDISVSTAHRYVNKIYPELKSKEKEKIVEEKKRLQYELETTQTTLFETIYAKLTYQILVNKISTKIYLWLSQAQEKNKLTENEVAAITSLIGTVLSDSIYLLVLHSDINQLKLIRSNHNKILEKLFDSTSFKNIINEYSLFTFLDKNQFSDNQLDGVLNRLYRNFNNLFESIISKVAFKEIASLSRFYPNGLIAKEYLLYKDKLPFKLSFTKSIRDAYNYQKFHSSSSYSSVSNRVNNIFK